MAGTPAAERAFARSNLERSLTDREVSPTLRRPLPTDCSADPIVRLGAAGRSGAPPGLG